MKAYLILADGQIFEGCSIGKQGETIGEVVYTTGMSGYMETLTDPSFFGQIIMHTFPLIGNAGAISADGESNACHAAGYIVRELCEYGSNFRKEEELNDYLVRMGVIGISGIDTRALTKHIRDKGTMNAMIALDTKNIEQKLARIKSAKALGAVAAASCKSVVESGPDGGYRVVLWDAGAKENITRELVLRGCRVIRVPHTYTAEQIMELNPDGVVISNGGGDPAENTTLISEIKKLHAYKIPTFGICLGHQMLCLSLGAKTKKLRYGHRGENQPVKDIKSGRVYITAQNHGYAVANLPQDKIKLTMINVNDKTCEAVEYLDFPGFSVQFHPEACGGPLDTMFLFDQFIKLIDANKVKRAI